MQKFPEFREKHELGLKQSVAYLKNGKTSLSFFFLKNMNMNGTGLFYRLSNLMKYFVQGGNCALLQMNGMKCYDTKNTFSW